jgi:gas vesicle protein
VNDRTPVVLGALAGALVGGLAGYLLFTERGRRLREDLEPRVRDVLTELSRAKDVLLDADASLPPSHRG